ncbi:SCO family protein [Sulfurimonas sp.]
MIQSFLFSSKTEGRISINKEVKADFIKSDKKVVLVFFGYVGCVDVCTPILYELDNLYKSDGFQNIKDDVEILFVNLTPEVREFQPDLFAKFFNNNFIGVYLSKKETLSIDRNFGVFFSRDLSDKTELNHTDYVYLIDNSSKLKILKSINTAHPLNKIKIIDDIISVIRGRDFV